MLRNLSIFIIWYKILKTVKYSHLPTTEQTTWHMYLKFSQPKMLYVSTNNNCSLILRNFPREKSQLPFRAQSVTSNQTIIKQ